MANLFQVTPFLHVPNLAEALDLFTRVLRFEIKYRVANYAYLECKGVGIRILEERGLPVVPISQARMTIYIDVDDVDELYEELRAELETLPAADVQSPVEQTWHQREFYVRLPDGHWLAFGQASKAQDASPPC